MRVTLYLVALLPVPYHASMPRARRSRLDR